MVQGQGFPKSMIMTSYICCNDESEDRIVHATAIEQERLLLFFRIIIVLRAVEESAVHQLEWVSDKWNFTHVRR